jgi:ribosomal protein L16 Arg81 hydroxylase
MTVYQDLSRFLSDAAQGQMAHVRASRHCNPGLLFDSKKLFDLLKNPLITPDWVQLAINGKALDFQGDYMWKSVQGKQLKFFDKRKLMLALENRASMVLEGLDILDENIAQLIESLDTVLPCTLSHCEAFWSRGGPGGNEAYGGHRDRDDVLVVQIEGTKRWRVYKQQQRRFTGNSPLTEAELGPLETDFVMEPGDVLYVKAGTPHWCTTPGDSSLHLSVDLNDQTPNVDQISQAANKAYFKGTAPAHSDPTEVIKAYVQTLQDPNLAAQMTAARDAFKEQARQFRAAIRGAHLSKSPV